MIQVLCDHCGEPIQERVLLRIMARAADMPETATWPPARYDTSTRELFNYELCRSCAAIFVKWFTPIEKGPA